MRPGWLGTGLATAVLAAGVALGVGHLVGGRDAGPPRVVSVAPLGPSPILVVRDTAPRVGPADIGPVYRLSVERSGLYLIRTGQDNTCPLDLWVYPLDGSAVVSGLSNRELSAGARVYLPVGDLQLLPGADTVHGACTLAFEVLPAA